MAVNSGPIPGENYTSDTKNYPWRQPPQYTDLDEALDFLANKLTNFKAANGILTMVEIGFPIYKIVNMLLMLGVSEGKWTVDYVYLLAGPLARMIELICIGFNVDYELGIYDDEDDFDTGTFFKEEEKLKTPNGNFKLLDEELPQIKEAAEDQSSGGDGEQVQDLQTEGFMQMSQGGEQKKEAK